MSMEGPCTEEQIIALEGIFDWIDLDNLQQQVIDAVGLDWADDINSAIANPWTPAMKLTLMAILAQADGLAMLEG